MVRGQLLDQRDPLGQRRVVGRGGEEPVPLPGLALDEVQPVPHVGDDAVDVDDGERSGVHGRRQTIAWSTKHQRQSSPGSNERITGWPDAAPCLLACRCGEESQQPM